MHDSSFLERIESLPDDAKVPVWEVLEAVRNLLRLRDDQILTVDQIAEITDRSPVTVRAWMRDIPGAVKPRKRWLVRKKYFDAWYYGEEDEDGETPGGTSGGSLRDFVEGYRN